VVADSTKRPVSGARVEVHGGGASQRTDSAGRFAFPEMKPGDYVVEATAPGVSSRPLMVTVPRGGAREVVLFLATDRAREPGTRWLYEDLGLRLAFAPARLHMNRDELQRSAGKRLCDIPRIQSVVDGDRATIVLDGVTVYYLWPLCDFEVDELALVEWSACVSKGLPVRSPGLGRSRGRSSRAETSCVMVWTR
jgi:hypothetical protein